MITIKRINIKSFEKGFYFKNGEYYKTLEPGKHWIAYLWGKGKVDIQSLRDPWIVHKNLDILVKENAFHGEAQVIDLKDNQRALVWIDGRFECVLTPGLYAIWKEFKKIKVETIEIDNAHFTHKNIEIIMKTESGLNALNSYSVEQGFVALYFNNGKYVETLTPGHYVFWKNCGKVKLYNIDMKEAVLDITGQDIMTADKVTIRINAMVNYKIIDALKSIQNVDDAKQTLYKEAQLALRAMIGTHELDEVLNKKNILADEIMDQLRCKSQKFGIAVNDVGIRDIILPGEMKELLNKVVEAKKAAEANYISRREETAAMRSQANTARLLENNPTLMRIKELEVLESVAKNSKLNVVIGEKGLTDSVLNVI